MEMQILRGGSSSVKWRRALLRNFCNGAGIPEEQGDAAGSASTRRDDELGLDTSPGLRGRDRSPAGRRLWLRRIGRALRRRCRACSAHRKTPDGSRAPCGSEPRLDPSRRRCSARWPASAQGEGGGSGIRDSFFLLAALEEKDVLRRFLGCRGGRPRQNHGAHGGRGPHYYGSKTGSSSGAGGPTS